MFPLIVPILLQLLGTYIVHAGMLQGYLSFLRLGVDLDQTTQCYACQIAVEYLQLALGARKLRTKLNSKRNNIYQDSLYNICSINTRIYARRIVLLFN